MPARARQCHPGELKARFNLRYSPVQTQDSLRKTVEGILDKHGVRYTIEWYVSGEPFYTPPGALSKAGVRRRCGRRRFTTETQHWRRHFGWTLHRHHGRPGGGMGVTNASIHKVNESVAVEEIAALHRMYLETLRRLLV